MSLAESCKAQIRRRSLRCCISARGEQNTILQNQLHALKLGIYRDKAIEKMFEKQINSFEKNKISLENRILEIIKTDPVLCSKFEKICKIKGLGILSLAPIIAETDGFAAFKSAAQLVSYSGYDIVENQSGKSQEKLKFQKKGIIESEEHCTFQLST